VTGEVAVGAVRPAGFHPFRVVGAVGHDDRHAFVLCVALKGPADGVTVIEVVAAVTEGALASRVQEQVDHPAVGIHPDLVALVLVCRSEVVCAEDAGISFVPQEDDGIGERFEPGLYGGFEALQGLRVVILDDGHCERGMLFGQRIVQDGAHVVAGSGL